MLVENISHKKKQTDQISCDICCSAGGDAGH